MAYGQDSGDQVVVCRIKYKTLFLSLGGFIAWSQLDLHCI